MELQLTDSEPALPVVNIPVRGENLEAWAIELMDCYTLMRQFPSMEIDEIFMYLAAFSARFSEIRVRLVRSQSREHSQFRTQQVDKFLDLCQFQFKIYSRLFTVKTMEYDTSKGGM